MPLLHTLALYKQQKQRRSGKPRSHNSMVNKMAVEKISFYITIEIKQSITISEKQQPLKNNKVVATR